MQRLDRYLSEAGIESRRKIKDIVRSGRVSVNGTVVRSPEIKIDEKLDQICLDGIPVTAGNRRIVLMMHKPAGCVTAATDPEFPTVMEYLPAEYKKLMPIGRLDKETEGLLLFTNDGDLAHRILAPKNRIVKTYYAEHLGTATIEDVEAFQQGCSLRDGTECLPAGLEILSQGNCLVRVMEGKYHQVRRMLASRGLPVQYLKRIAEGEVFLGDLPIGKTRELTEMEITQLETVQFDEKFSD